MADRAIEAYIELGELGASATLQATVAADLSSITPRVLTRLYIPADPDEGNVFKFKQDWDDFVSGVKAIDEAISRFDWAKDK